MHHLYIWLCLPVSYHNHRSASKLFDQLPIQQQMEISWEISHNQRGCWPRKKDVDFSCYFSLLHVGGLNHYKYLLLVGSPCIAGWIPINCWLVTQWVPVRLFSQMLRWRGGGIIETCVGSKHIRNVNILCVLCLGQWESCATRDARAYCTAHCCTLEDRCTLRFLVDDHQG